MKKVNMNFPEQFFATIGENQVFMSFNDDSGAYAFQEWWGDEGEKHFTEWCLESDEYRDDVEKYGIES